MILLVIVLAGIGSYLFRSVFILALADRTPPPVVSKALRNVGPAVLSALVVTDLWGRAPLRSARRNCSACWRPAWQRGEPAT